MTSTIEQLNSDGRVHGADAAPAETAVSDETLLKRYCDSADREAFEALVHRYEGELYSYLRRYLGDAAMAEDAFQTTFLQVHLKRHLFEQGRKVRPWLYTIATNQAIDAQRRNKRHRMVSRTAATERLTTTMSGLCSKCPPAVSLDPLPAWNCESAVAACKRRLLRFPKPCEPR